MNKYDEIKKIIEEAEDGVDFADFGNGVSEEWISKAEDRSVYLGMNAGGELKKMGRALGKAKDTLKEDSKVTEGVSNLKYRVRYDKYLIEVEDIVWKKGKGIVGGHNFESVFKSNDWSLNEYIISKKTHLTIDGIYEIEYRLPAKDAAQNYVKWQYKKVATPKTVYDPSKISNSKIIAWGKEAMKNGTTNFYPSL